MSDTGRMPSQKQLEELSQFSGRSVADLRKQFADANGPPSPKQKREQQKWRETRDAYLHFVTHPWEGPPAASGTATDRAADAGNPGVNLGSQSRNLFAPKPTLPTRNDTHAVTPPQRKLEGVSIMEHHLLAHELRGGRPMPPVPMPRYAPPAASGSVEERSSGGHANPIPPWPRDSYGFPRGGAREARSRPVRATGAPTGTAGPRKPAEGR